MDDQPPRPRYITAAEAAEMLGVSVATIRRLATAGRLPGVRLGRTWRFRESDLASLPPEHDPPD